MHFWVRTLAVASMLAAGVPADARAEDGYDLWLRYRRVADAARLTEYRAALTSVVAQGSSPTLAAARDELVAGLTGLLGRRVGVSGRLVTGSVVIGTPASSPAIAALGLASALRGVGDDGFVIRAMPVNGARAIVIAANRDVGALYGAFHLLRVLQTNQSLVRLNIASAPKVQWRMLNLSLIHI